MNNYNLLRDYLLSEFNSEIYPNWPYDIIVNGRCFSRDLTYIDALLESGLLLLEGGDDMMFICNGSNEPFEEWLHDKFFNLTGGIPRSFDSKIIGVMMRLLLVKLIKIREEESSEICTFLRTEMNVATPILLIGNIVVELEKMIYEVIDVSSSLVVCMLADVDDASRYEALMKDQVVLDQSYDSYWGLSEHIKKLRFIEKLSGECDVMSRRLRG